MSFTSRLYAELDVSLSRVRLYQSLRQIVSQPLIYIRDIVPRACLDTVVGLHQVSNPFPVLAVLIKAFRLVFPVQTCSLSNFRRRQNL